MSDTDPHDGLVVQARAEFGSAEPRICPVCGGVNPALRNPDIADGERYCTPLSCSAWTFTHRLTKQGPKPIRADGRADLRAAGES